jgi:hypothetical protein
MPPTQVKKLYLACIDCRRASYAELLTNDMVFNLNLISSAILADSLSKGTERERERRLKGWTCPSAWD